MTEWWNSLSTLSQALYAVAFPATLLLLIQTVLMFIGLGHTTGDAFGGGMEGDAVGTDVGGVDFDAGAMPDGAQVDGGFDLNGDGAADADGVWVDGGVDTTGDGQPDVFPETDAPDPGTQHAHGLHWFTFRGVVAFLCIGSWTAIATLDSGLHPALAVTIALLAGLLALFLVAWLMRAALKLQQSGNLDVRNAVGQVGEVYLTIPQGGKGKVTVMVQERLLDFDAVSDRAPLENGRQVRVIGVAPGDILVVIPV